MNYRHTGIHELSMKEYRALYPQAKLDDIDVLERIGKKAEQNWKDSIYIGKQKEATRNGTHKRSEEFKQHMSQVMSGKPKSEEHKRAISRNKKKEWEDLDYRERQSKSRKGKTRPNISISTKKLWDDPEYREKQILAHIKPIDLEKYPAKCEICGKYFKVISAVHLKTHSVTKEEYINLYPNAMLQSSWNKGKTKEDDPRIAEYGKKISEVQKGQPGRQTGKHWKLSDEAKQNIGKGSKKNWDNPEYREKQDKRKRDYWSEPDNRLRASLRMQEIWQGEEYRNKVFAGWNTAPNKEEVRFLGLLNEIDPKGEWEFTGNTKVPIFGKKPDFYSYGRNKIIEYFGTPWHKEEEPEERTQYFESQGVPCLIVWSHEFMQRKNFDNTVGNIIDFISI